MAEVGVESQLVGCARANGLRPQGETDARSQDDAEKGQAECMVPVSQTMASHNPAKKSEPTLDEPD
jgi:hypothetical protein